MNGPGDLPLQHYSSTPDSNNCSIISIIPNLGMSSCRGRAEAFARRLSSKLRTLGSQGDEGENSPEDEPIINGDTPNNTWVTGHESEQTVTALQPLRHESDSFFDFDCELESPGSPVDECEYLRLIESTSNTPHTSAAESGYACASAASSHSSSDGPYYDVNSETEGPQQKLSQTQTQTPPQTPPHQTVYQPHACEQPDEVDCAKPPKVSPAHEPVPTSLCNGHDASVSTESSQTSESHHITTDVTKSLPSEGPDIDETNHLKQKREPAIKQNGMSHSIQDQILRELQRQSLEITDEELEASNKSSQNKEKVTETETIKSSQSTQKVTETETYKSNQNTQKVTETETIVKENEENLSKVIHTLINGHAENGEEVLKIEVCEVEEAQGKPQLEPQLATQLAPQLASQLASPLASQLAPELASPLAPQQLAEEAKECPAITQEPISQVPPEKTELSTADQQPETETKPQSRSHPSLHHDTTDDEDECRPQRVRRCSSLKTGKTPPGTPGRKKIVRFADVLGLDLADIKTFLDEVPTIPKSAYEDLEILESEPPVQLGPKADKLLMPLFQQPGGLPSFLDVVRAKQVSLENAAVTDTINHTITGSVRVRNLDFNKSVHIRYSLDGWRSFADLQANYVENSCDGFSDKFSFVIFGNSLHIGQRLEFAVRFQCKGQQYWDNNYGSNYCFQCLPTSTVPAPVTVLPSHHSNNMIGLLSPTAGEAWCSSFY